MMDSSENPRPQATKAIVAVLVSPSRLPSGNRLFAAISKSQDALTHYMAALYPNLMPPEQLELLTKTAATAGASSYAPEPSPVPASNAAPQTAAAAAILAALSQTQSLAEVLAQVGTSPAELLAALERRGAFAGANLAVSVPVCLFLSLRLLRYACVWGLKQVVFVARVDGAFAFASHCVRIGLQSSVLQSKQGEGGREERVQ
ncbi:unnamed protein product [Schistocephalus solidus]|uniref:EKC/KEOPS complex subunit CGI121 n=1 Tax=Schistocephalus solidus TaxID=70667 RepID=A0A183TKW1_SCHSO|nr:unnamed protein product [Schistocephalus solidus]